MTKSINEKSDRFSFQPNFILVGNSLNNPTASTENFITDGDSGRYYSTEFHSDQSPSSVAATMTGSVPLDDKSHNQKSVFWSLVKELVETIVLSLIIFLLVRQVVQNYRIESHSMEPNFYEGQFILVNKLAYRFGDPARGDVIVFHNPRNQEEDYIKRVIGLPGDTLEIANGQIYINGELLNEPFTTNQLRPTTRVGPDVIQPNQLFVMGDNRPNSSDSRSFGQLSQDLIVGKAWVRVWPVPNWGLIQHYQLEPGNQVPNGP